MKTLLPVATALLLFATNVFAATGGGVRVEVKDDRGQPVADAVSSLVPLDTRPVLTPPAEPVVIEQVGEEFTPYVTPVLVGTRVAFPNNDRVQHHVYSLSSTKTFELPLYRGSVHDPVVFDLPGIVSLGCNIHDWMAAYVVVLATPHFAKTGGDGTSLIASLPPGRYRLEVWHPRLAAAIDREVVVAPEDPATQVIAITLRPDRRIRRAPEAHSGGYP